MSFWKLRFRQSSFGEALWPGVLEWYGKEYAEMWKLNPGRRTEGLFWASAASAEPAAEPGMWGTSSAVRMFSSVESGTVVVGTEQDLDINGTATAWFDRQSRLHREDGGAVEYSDGRVEYHWHGVEVPSHVVLDPDTITAEEIDAEQNLEVRRVMIERFPGGLAALMKAQGSTLIHKDETGELWGRAPTPTGARTRAWRNDLTIFMVKVINSSPEPDGTFREYWLRVPPSTRTARQGVAWTFGMTEDTYKPGIET